jgi:lipopolysaccharide export system protein LptA
MRNHQQIILSLIIAAGILLYTAGASFGVEGSVRNMKVKAGRFSLVSDKITATGNVTVTSSELTLKSSTVTWFLDASGNIKTMEANGNVTFHLVTIGQTGGTLTADGEGDNLVYSPNDNTVIVTVAAGKKAHIHSIEQLPLPAGATPGQAKPTRNYDVKASTITIDLKARSFEAEGEAELNVALPEKTSPAGETPGSEPKKP